MRLAVTRFACGDLLLRCSLSLLPPSAQVFVIPSAARNLHFPSAQLAPKSPEPAQPGLLGKWGGQHLAVSVTTKGASLEFDCAHGQFDKPLRPDRLGRFAVRGVFVEEHGGPIRMGEVPKSHPASYAGTIKGNRMTLTVRLLDTRQQVGTFLLRRGHPAHLFKCK